MRQRRKRYLLLRTTPGYGLIGGRVCYAEPPHRIQIDGGTVNRWTGVTSNINLGAEAAQAPVPKGEDMDFVTGANLVASRRFYETVGPMREDCLYYEEADWALRRGTCPSCLLMASSSIIMPVHLSARPHLNAWHRPFRSISNTAAG